MFNYISSFIDLLTKPTLTDEYIIEKWKKDNKGELLGFSTDEEAKFIDTTIKKNNKTVSSNL